MSSSAGSKSIVASANALLKQAAKRSQSGMHVNSSKLPKELIKSSQAWFTAAPSGGVHSLPDLPYDYNALEPAISAETMTIHHSKHHNTYVTNLNVTLEKLDKAVSAGDVSGVIALQGALKFNGGGHLNHTLFWENLSPTTTTPSGSLADAITKSFGSVEGLQKQFVPATVGVQGSGWGWLGYNKTSGLLEIATCANQDPLEATTGLVPIVGIDVWEHAYYVDYRNVRPDYVNASWGIINWDTAQKRFDATQ
jgi:Fe-Mn family superoxide dismutase